MYQLNWKEISFETLRINPQSKTETNLQAKTNNYRKEIQNINNARRNSNNYECKSLSVKFMPTSNLENMNIKKYKLVTE